MARKLMRIRAEELPFLMKSQMVRNGITVDDFNEQGTACKEAVMDHILDNDKQIAMIYIAGTIGKKLEDENRYRIDYESWSVGYEEHIAEAIAGYLKTNLTIAESVVDKVIEYLENKDNEN